MKMRTALATRVSYSLITPFNWKHTAHAVFDSISMLTRFRRVDEAPRYERDRSASPRPTRRNDSPRGNPRRSASPNGNGHMDSRLVFTLLTYRLAR